MSAKRIITIRGSQVDLDAVEGLLGALDLVARAAVVAVPTDRGCELVAHVESSAAPADGEAVRRRFGATVPPAMVPIRVVVHESLTPSGGDIDRSDLVESASSEAPVGSEEQRIAALWGRSLGVPVGRYDDFFALGGDLPLAARTIELLEESADVVFAPSILLERPTVAGLVAASADGPSTSSIATIQGGASDGSPLVLGYDLDGSALTMRDLAHAIGPDRRVWGLDCPLRSGEGGPTDLAGLAARHCADLVRALPDGPYLLAGYSLGAFLVYEMAVQLLASGRPVDFLGLLDMGPVHSRHRLGRREMVHPPDRWPWRPRSDLPPWQRWSATAHAAMTQAPGHRVEHLARAFRLGPRHDLVRARRDVRAGERVRRELRAAWCWYLGMEALVAYDPPRYDGPVTLFVSDQTAKGNFRASARLDYASRTDPTLGWSETATDVDVRPVVGSHADMIEQPYVWGLGREVRRALDEATARSKDGR